MDKLNGRAGEHLDSSSLDLSLAPTTSSYSSWRPLIHNFTPVRQYDFDTHGAIPAPKLEADKKAPNEETIDCQTPNVRERSWPSAPQTLSRSFANVTLSLFLDVVLVIAPITFLILAFSAVRLDNQPLSTWGHKISRLQQLSPTLFPIIFAAIVGNLMSTMARWRAQRGDKLASLEQLNGSQSLASTLRIAILLRRFHPISIAIVAIWALSPLGGQSALRMMHQRPSDISRSSSLRYLNTALYDFDYMGASEWQDIIAQVTGLFQSSLVASSLTRLSSRDPWGNVKIPMIESLEKTLGRSMSNDSWISLEKFPYLYSSLVGLVIVGLPADGITSFSTESSYLTLDCPEWLAIRPSGELQVDFPGFMINHTDPGRCQLQNPFSVNYNNYTSSHAPNIIAVQASMGRPAATVANCSMSSSRVETRVTCHGKSCAATDIRRSQVPPPNNQSTPFDEDFVTFWNLLRAFPDAAGCVMDGSMVTPVLVYLAADPENLYADLDVDHWQLTNTSVETFSTRLTQLWNTYLLAAWAPKVTAGGASTNLSLYEDSAIQNSWSNAWQASVWGDERVFPSLPITANTTFENGSVYEVDWVFISLLLGVTLIMELCAITCIVLKTLCKTPDILGYVSSLTRQNAFLDAPDGGSTLGGLERARMMGDMRVQIGDVRWDEEVGQIELRRLQTIRDKTRQTAGREGRIDKQGKTRVYL